MRAFVTLMQHLSVCVQHAFVSISKCIRARSHSQQSFRSAGSVNVLWC
jgi:hypothetical protein